MTTPLRTDYANGTVSLDTHVAAHNDANGRINSLVSGGSVSVVASLPAAADLVVGRLYFQESDSYVYLALNDATIGKFAVKVAGPLAVPGLYSRTVKADGPVAYWPLNDPAGSTTVKDEGPNALTGGVHATPKFGEPKLFPTGSTSVFLAGDNSHITVPHATALEALRGSYSIEGWWKVVDYGTNYRAFVTKQTSNGSNPLDMWQQNGALHHFLSGSVYTGPTLAAAKAFHLVVTRDQANGELRFYVDGAQTHLVAAKTGLLTDDLKPLRIGARDDLVTKMHGHVSDVAIYNKVLTASQIKSHYDAAKVSG